jgi:uncharacterized protein YecE (DUF72 family)
MTLFAGTSGWAYPAWKPDFYPPKLPAKNFLNFYSSHLNSVEVNYTFRSAYSMKPELARKWIEQSAPGFTFSFKAPQAITHQKQYRLENAGELVEAFTSRLRPFQEAGKLGTVLFQLPPFFAANPTVLEFFLRAWPKDIRCTFEFRHKSWFGQPTYDVLAKHNAALCIAQADKLDTPEVITADFVYYRLRHTDYSPKALRQIADTVRSHINSGKDVHAYFKHEEESVVSTERALNLQKAIADPKQHSAA